MYRPSHALYFAAYEASKQKLGGNQPGHHVLATGVSGVVATLVNDTIMTPLDVVKQRLQVHHTATHMLRHAGSACEHATCTLQKGMAIVTTQQAGLCAGLKDPIHRHLGLHNAHAAL